MYIARFWISMLIVVTLLGAQWLMSNWFDWSAQQTLAFILIEIVAAIPIMSWLTRPSEQTQTQSQRRVEKLMRELKDEDLDLLRSRLGRNDYDEAEYGSMGELIQSGKRKNEMS